TPGGLGLVEFTYIGGIILAGRGRTDVSPDIFHAQVAGAVLLFRALTYGVQIPLGGFAYLIYRATSSWRHPAGGEPQIATGRLAAVFVVAISGSIWLHATTRPLDRFDAVIARFVVALRVGWLDSVARALNAVGSRWGLAALGLLAVALAMVFRRWRHLIVFLVS